MTLRYDKGRDEIMVSDGGGPELRDDILALVKREIAAEREACAKIAERRFDQPGDPELDIPVDVARETIAAAIRARGETPA